MTETIEVYTLNVRLAGETKTLSFSKDDDVYELLKEKFPMYIEGGRARKVCEAEQRMLRVRRKNDKQNFWDYDDKNRYISGIILSGKYGKKLRISNKNGKKGYTSEDSNDAVMKPFFFLIYIPRKMDTGLVVLERTDNESIRSMFQKLLTDFLNGNRKINGENQKYVVQFNNFLSSEFVNSLKDGSIQSVKVNMSKLPADLSVEYGEGRLKNNTSVTLTMKFKGGLCPDSRLARAIKKGETIFSEEAFSSYFDEGQRQIVTKSMINGVPKRRTVYLSDEKQNKMRPYYDVTVKQHSDGYVDYYSIRKAVYDFINNTKELRILE